MAEYVYDGSYEKLREATERAKAGDTLLCARCRSPLIVVLTPEDKQKYHRNEGLYCPKDQHHVMIVAH